MEVVVGVLIGFFARVSVFQLRWKQCRKGVRPQPTCLTPFMGADRELRELHRRPDRPHRPSSTSSKNK
ncbi:MAG: hypothetical protein H8K08_17940 [Nitrospira sp.]|nr:hypothetical protein [Nitrospira sp.]